MGNIQNTFRQAPRWWWWTQGHIIFHNRETMFTTAKIMLRLLFTQVCILCMSSVWILPYSLIKRGGKMDRIFQETNSKGSAWTLSWLLTTHTVLGDLGRHWQHKNVTFGSEHLVISSSFWVVWEWTNTSVLHTHWHCAVDGYQLQELAKHHQCIYLMEAKPLLMMQF